MRLHFRFLLLHRHQRTRNIAAVLWLLLAGGYLQAAELALRSAAGPASELDDGAAPSATSLVEAPAIDRTGGTTERSEPLPIRSGESQLWLVSTRTLPGPGVSVCNGALEVYYFPQCGGAIASSLDEFLASDDPQLTTVVYVHGNGVEAAGSATEGSMLCRAVTACGGRPIRFVIWSWPSELQQCPLLKDLRLKLSRTNVEPFYLGDFIQRLPANEPLCLIGFSFGCRVAAGTLHVLGGGAIEGQSLGNVVARSPIRAVLLAAAVGNEALMPQGRFNRAVSQTEHILITVNPRDRVLRYFPLLREDRSLAVGVTGVIGFLGDLGGQIAHINVTNYLHHHHAFRKYLQVPEVMNILRREIDATGHGDLHPAAPIEVDTVGQSGTPLLSDQR